MDPTSTLRTLTRDASCSTVVRALDQHRTLCRRGYVESLNSHLAQQVAAASRARREHYLAADTRPEQESVQPPAQLEQEPRNRSDGMTYQPCNAYHVQEARRKKPTGSRCGRQPRLAQEPMLYLFLFRPNCFVLSQTEGNDVVAATAPNWNAERALSALGITCAEFTTMNGNAQGYMTVWGIRISSRIVLSTFSYSEFAFVLRINSPILYFSLTRAIGPFQLLVHARPISE